MRGWADPGSPLSLVYISLQGATAVVAFSQSLNQLYTRHCKRANVVGPISLFVVLGGAFCAVQTRSMPELIIVFIPMLLAIGFAVRLLWEGISEWWVVMFGYQ